MSETWHATRSSISRFREAWRSADEDTRTKFWCWVLGMSMMATAIVGEFGWHGLGFCVGFVVWAAGTAK